MPATLTSGTGPAWGGNAQAGACRLPGAASPLESGTLAVRLPVRDMMMRSYSTAIAFLGVLALTGCTASNGPWVVRLEDLPEGADIVSAPDQVEVASRQYILETYLWRDFMPISPPDGKPLIAKATILATDLQPFPSDLDADRLYVINGEEAWVVDLPARQGPLLPDYQLKKIARDGPKWGPDVTVDVVVRLVEPGGSEYLLRAVDQMIWRTD